MIILGKHEEGWGELQIQFAYIERAVISSSIDKAVTEDVARGTILSMRDRVRMPGGDVIPGVGIVIATDRRSQSDDAVEQVVMAPCRAKNAKRGRYALVEGAH